MRLPHFRIMVERMLIVHQNKNMDYANDTNPLANFDRSAEIISWFRKDEDKTFANHVANKLTRLAELLSRETPPKNEPVEDSFLDLATYVVLWYCHYRRRIERTAFLEESTFHKSATPFQTSPRDQQ